MSGPQEARLAKALETARGGGLDVQHAFARRQIACWKLDAPAQARCILLGHTGALWEPFQTALTSSNTLRNHSDPLDTYITDLLKRAFGPLDIPHRLILGYGEPPLPPLQRICHESGLAHLGPAHLCVHPEHGPWFALRALVVLPDLEGPDVPTAPPLCQSCHGQPCVPRFEAALQASTHPTLQDVHQGWRAWLAVRDACPHGLRYSTEQIRFHYSVSHTEDIPS